MEGPTPTAGGDAPVIEVTKTNRSIDDSSSAAAIKPAHVEITSENVAVEMNHPISTGAEANKPAEGVADSGTKTTDTNAEDPEKDATAAACQPASAQPPDEKKADDNSERNIAQAKGDNAASVSQLEEQVRSRTKERDAYRKKLEDTEKKLAVLQTTYNATTRHAGDETGLQRSVDQLRGQLAQTALMYEERNQIVASQENQINALNNQVTSLKEVVSITRDLLQIRNMEVKQLQTEVDSMERKIAEERDRHNAMISKMDAAMRLNADLKKEYETQLSLFQSLREKYGEKITLLSEEKRALEAAASTPAK
ncbi:PREDICTED: neurofilament heavy polypeptide-like isoform X2 [Dinoponera quadriceps]|uniref:Neurofilament heavy polypeptide-like isoform X2 n=1 Tax=Dinoponera quadriceps TaxID=609295 RepID=A0A6P3XLP7_DINQU|nr:PREDICTED: neurofilament heavy polypeptide-like isoform X2 [Dinoponera quadriceps]